MLLSTKMSNFASFPRRKITDASLFVVFFPRGDRIQRMVLEDWGKAASNGKEKLWITFKVTKKIVLGKSKCYTFCLYFGI